MSIPEQPQSKEEIAKELKILKEAIRLASQIFPELSEFVSKIPKMTLAYFDSEAYERVSGDEDYEDLREKIWALTHAQPSYTEKTRLLASLQWLINALEDKEEKEVETAIEYIQNSVAKLKEEGRQDGFPPRDLSQS